MAFDINWCIICLSKLVVLFAAKVRTIDGFFLFFDNDVYFVHKNLNAGASLREGIAWVNLCQHLLTSFLTCSWR
jgi:hypothetical protein